MQIVAKFFISQYGKDIIFEAEYGVAKDIMCQVAAGRLL